MTSCVHPDLKVQVLTILKRPPYIMLPVKLLGVWYDYGIQVIKETQLLLRAKKFDAALILGISALITVITSFSLSTIALTQQVHTAHHVNELSKNVSLALATQE